MYVWSPVSSLEKLRSIIATRFDSLAQERESKAGSFSKEDSQRSYLACYKLFLSNLSTVAGSRHGTSFPSVAKLFRIGPPADRVMICDTGTERRAIVKM